MAPFLNERLPRLSTGSVLGARASPPPRRPFGTSLRVREPGLQGFLPLAARPAMAVPPAKGLDEACAWLRQAALTPFPPVTKSEQDYGHGRNKTRTRAQYSVFSNCSATVTVSPSGPRKIEGSGRACAFRTRSVRYLLTVAKKIERIFFWRIYLKN